MVTGAWLINKWPIMHLSICLAVQQESVCYKGVWFLTILSQSSGSHWLITRAYFWRNRLLMIITAPWLITPLPLFLDKVSAFFHFSGSTLETLRTPSHRLTQGSDHKPMAAPSDEVASSWSSCWRRQLSKCLCKKKSLFLYAPIEFHDKCEGMC